MMGLGVVDTGRSVESRAPPLGPACRETLARPRSSTHLIQACRSNDQETGGGLVKPPDVSQLCISRNQISKSYFRHAQK